MAQDFEQKVNELYRQLSLYQELIKEKKFHTLTKLKKLECIKIEEELQISWKFWKKMVARLDRQYILLES